MWQSLYNNYTTNMVYVLFTQQQSFDIKMKPLFNTAQDKS